MYPFYYFGIIQYIQSFCIYWEISDIQKGHFHSSWLRGREIVMYIKLGFLKKIRLWFRILLILDFKITEQPQTLVPFSENFSTLVIHSRLFKQIFLKLFFLKNFSPLQRMFPKLYGSNSISDVLTTSVHLYCILYYKAAVFNGVLLYLLCVLSVLFLCCGEQIPK